MFWSFTDEIPEICRFQASVSVTTRGDRRNASIPVAPDQVDGGGAAIAHRGGQRPASAQAQVESGERTIGGLARRRLTERARDARRESRCQLQHELGPRA